MNNEKMLAFFNIDSSKKVDKFSLKLFTWFNVSWGLLAVLCGAVFWLDKSLEFSLLDALFVIYSIISNIIFFVFIRYIKSNIYEWFHHLIVSLSSVFTLLYGWHISSNGEFADCAYPKLSLMHIAVLFASFVLSAYMIIKLIWAFKLLEKNTIEQTRNIINSKAPLFPVIAISGSPMILVRALRGPFAEMGLGLGFAFWCLMCVWLFFVLSLLPRIFIIIKFKVYRIKNN